MKKINITWKKMLILFIIFTSTIGIIYSVLNIIIWFFDNEKQEAQIEEINEKVEIEERIDTENTKIINNQYVPEFNSYWDYIKMNLIDVDFTELKEINTDTKGWIQLGGTNINYPFVQANDNEYYLNHSFKREYNQTGWVFLDYRNDAKELNKNTIIYGHALINGTMFGTLKNILKSSWQSNINNHIVKLSTEYENTLWQVFSVYTISNTSDYLKVNFNTLNDFINFKDMLINRSVYDFKTDVNENDKILTLSTCYKTSNNKVVLHAKLIKLDKK